MILLLLDITLILSLSQCVIKIYLGDTCIYDSCVCPCISNMLYWCLHIIYMCVYQEIVMQRGENC